MKKKLKKVKIKLYECRIAMSIDKVIQVYAKDEKQARERAMVSGHWVNESDPGYEDVEDIMDGPHLVESKDEGLYLERFE